MAKQLTLVDALRGAAVEKRATMSGIDGRGRGGWMPWINEPYTGAWQKNDEWCAEDLLASPIVYACVTLIANDIGKLRPKLVQKTEDGIWVEQEGASPFWGPLRNPNRYQNHIQFKQWWITSKLRFGNSYALKERDSRGMVSKLYLLDPCRVTPLVADDGSIYYQLGQDNLTGVRATDITVPASEIIHDRMNCLYHPLVGIAPLYAAAIAAGVGLHIQRNTGRFFHNAAMPSGILVAPGNISPENARAVGAAWNTNYTGSNAGKVAVLGDGLKFEPIGQKATDSQLIQVLNWTDERVCSVFHVPGFKVGVGAMPSYDNVEALDRSYYSSCLQSLIEEMEACLDSGLNMDGYSKGVELDLEGLIRMDGKSQMESLKAGVEGSLLTINNGRQKLNLPPLPGGDTVYMQQQDFPLDQVRDNKISAAEPAPVAQPVPAPAAPAQVEEDEEEQTRALTAALTKALQDGLTA